MQSWVARHIRRGLFEASLADCFRGHFTYQTAVDHHRAKLKSTVALAAFDRAVQRADHRAFVEELRISTEFADIINRNFQETT